MGVEPKDCRIVARMVGIKTFINEFIAYEDLGKVKANRKTYHSLMGTSSLLSGDWMVDGSSNWIHKGANVTLAGGMITVSIDCLVTTLIICSNLPCYKINVKRTIYNF